MKCKEVQENLSFYLDQELSEEELLLVQSHLDSCSVCREELAALQETVSLLSSLEEVNPPASFRRELYAKLEKSIVQETEVKKKRLFGHGLRAKLTALRQHAAFYPVAISLVLLIIIVPVFFDVRIGSNFNKDASSKQEMLSYGVSMDQDSAPQENMVKGIAPQESAYNLERGVSLTDQAPQVELSSQNEAKQSLEQSKSQTKPLERKLIKNAEMLLLVDNYDRATESLKNKVRALNGYITNESANVIDARGSKRGYLEVRIPQYRFDEFLSGVNNLGKLKNSHIYTQDVTEEYIDVESRLRTMHTKEDRLLDILTQSGKLSDILAVENELANTRAQLESFEGRLRYLNNQTDFSTFNLTLEQVVASTQQVSASGLQGVGARAKEAFIQAINNIFLGLGTFLVFLSAAIPYLIVVAVIIGIVWGIWRGMKKGKK